MGQDPTYGLRFTAEAFDRLGLGERWAYYDAPTERWLGPAGGCVLDFLGTADVLLNISGVNPLRPWFLEVPVRALIDTDPVFTQVRHLTDAAARSRAEAHTVFFTFGENLPGGRSTIPSDGLPWLPTRQPVVLDAWPALPAPQGGCFTTVMQWDTYPARTYAGQRYGVKADSFEPFLDLPCRTRVQLELALGSGSAPRAQLRQRGWRLCDPLEVARDPWTYQQYIRASRAEFAVAKHGYVISRSGWFSERSACYLASGRPVLAQDTGFTDYHPVGAGALAFADPVQAVDGLAEIDRNCAFHVREARGVAETYFDATKVLPALLERAGSPSRRLTVGKLPG
jgi:hypothetical protein